MTTLINSSQINHSGQSLESILDAASVAPLQLSTSYDPPSLAAGSSASQSFTLTGAQLGDFVQVSYSLSLGGLNLFGYVSAPNQVTAVFHNITAGTVDPSAGTLRFRLTRST